MTRSTFQQEERNLLHLFRAGLAELWGRDHKSCNIPNRNRVDIPVLKCRQTNPGLPIGSQVGGRFSSRGDLSPDHLLWTLPVILIRISSP